MGPDERIVEDAYKAQRAVTTALLFAGVLVWIVIWSLVR